MMISTTSDYGLRLMVALAESSTSPMKSDAIARAAHLPQEYSVKVLQMLERADLVASQRGRCGGFHLTCDPATVSLLDVVNAITPVKRLSCCREARPGESLTLCPLHQRLEEVHRKLLDTLGNTMLKDVVKDVPGPAQCRADDERPAKPVTVAATASHAFGRPAGIHAGADR
jgi:Rrf2 family protein